MNNLMIKLTHKTLILTIPALLILLAVGCKQPDAGVSVSGQESFTENNLFAALSLQRGEITASDAAKKIAAQNGLSVGNLSFSEAKFLAYDDKAGTFTVKVKGTKGGQSFDKTFNVSGFTHPYKDLILLDSIVSYDESKPVLDKAVAQNMGLTAFINAANAAKGIEYTSFSYTLVGSDKTVSIGDHSAYKLDAVFSENAGKIKIEAKYYINYKTYTGSGTEHIELESASTKTVSDNEPYFTKEDVFKYILEEVKKDEGFIQTQNKFASEFYARAVTSNKTPEGLFDTSKLQKYREVYQTKEEGKHLALPDIDAAVFDPRNNGIKADDFAGTLDVSYYIATKNLIENIGSNGFIPETFTTTKKTGFRIMNEDTAKDLFSFSLTRSSGNLHTWAANAVANKFLVKEEGTFNEHNWLTVGTNDVLGYTLSLNGYSDFQFNKNVLADKDTAFLSRGTNGELILIRSIKLSKPKNERSLNISITFEGINDGVDGKPIVLTREPLF